MDVKTLVNFFYKRNIELFIQIGSSTEYGKQKSPNIENNNGKPNTIYAQSKLKASKFLIKFSKKFFSVCNFKILSSLWSRTKL